MVAITRGFVTSGAGVEQSAKIITETRMSPKFLFIVFMIPPLTFESYLNRDADYGIDPSSLQSHLGIRRAIG